MTLDERIRKKLSNKYSKTELEWFEFKQDLSTKIYDKEKINQLCKVLTMIFSKKEYVFSCSDRNEENGHIGMAIKGDDSIGVYYIYEQLKIEHNDYNILKKYINYSKFKGIKRSIIITNDIITYDYSLLENRLYNQINIVHFSTIASSLTKSVHSIGDNKSDFELITNIVEREFTFCLNVDLEMEETFYEKVIHRVSHKIIERKFDVELIPFPSKITKWFLRCKNSKSNTSYMVGLNFSPFGFKSNFIHLTINYDRGLGRRLAGFFFKENVSEYFFAGDLIHEQTEGNQVFRVSKFSKNNSFFWIPE